jgi:methylated-DNA-[protein]-cysteine S-methyltransferase
MKNAKFLKKMRAGNADSGPLIRRRRREVALVNNLTHAHLFCMTLNLRLTYDFERFFYRVIGGEECPLWSCHRERREEISHKGNDTDRRIARPESGLQCIIFYNQMEKGYQPLLKKTAKLSFTNAAFIPDTPAGSLALAVSNNGLARLFFCARESFINFLADHDLAEDSPADGLLGEAVRQVSEYFAGQRKVFILPLDLAGQSPFREQALRQCSRIPFGQVITYGQLAARAGNPNAARAAGGAMANNPIALVIPCHRVVGSDRGLHGFSSPGGLRTKAVLLRHEGVSVEEERVK